MELTFERGERDKPKGHALLYFRNPADQNEVLASYLVVPPVPLNLSKYVPPLFAGNIPQAQLQQVSAIPLPPVPEVLESRAYLQQLAESRDDDLIYGGTLDPSDVQRGLMLAGEAAQTYLQLYEDYQRRLPPLPAEEQQPELEVSDVLYSLMSENQRLGELAKLTGKLRYAVDGNDQALAKETVREMEMLAHYVPEKYRVPDLIAAARQPGPTGQRLSQLYVDRCYRLAAEDYTSLKQIEEEIRQLQA